MVGDNRPMADCEKNNPINQFYRCFADDRLTSKNMNIFSELLQDIALKWSLPH